MSRKRKKYTKEKELTRHDKLLAVCMCAMEELAEVGLLEKVESGFSFTKEGKAKVAEWDKEENFTDEEIKRGMDELFASGTIKLVA